MSTKWKRLQSNRRRRVLSKISKKQVFKPRMRVRGRLQIRQPIHYFNRHVARGTVQITNGSSSVVGAIRFALSDVHNFAEYKAMYDFFQLRAVRISFIPLSNVTLGTGGGFTYDTNYSNRFFTAIDYNDSSTPSSVNELREYANCRWSPGNRIHKRYFRPKPILATDEDSGSGASYGLAEGKNIWISTASDSTYYFGVKYGYQHPTGVTTGDAYVIECTYYMCFKGPK